MGIFYRLTSFLEALQSKTSAYYGITVVVLLFQIFFGVRAASIYYIFFTPLMGDLTIMGAPIFLYAVWVIVFLALSIMGYYVAAHKPNSKWLFGGAMTISLLHDWGVLIYADFFNAAKSWNPTSIEHIIPVFGFGLISIMVLMLGRWTETLYPQVQIEREGRSRNLQRYLNSRVEGHAMREVFRLLKKMPKERMSEFVPAEFQAVAHKITGTTVNGNLITTSRTDRPSRQLAQPRKPVLQPTSIEEDEYEDDEDEQYPAPVNNEQYDNDDYEEEEEGEDEDEDNTLPPFQPAKRNLWTRLHLSRKQPA